MVFHKGLSGLLHTIASASVHTLLAKRYHLLPYDNSEETRKVKEYRDARLRQERRKIASFKQLDTSQLPLVINDRSVLEQAILEAGSQANLLKFPARNTPARNNGSRSKQKIDTAIEIRLEPWIYKAYAAEFQVNKETI